MSSFHVTPQAAKETPRIEVQYAQHPAHPELRHPRARPRWHRTNEHECHGLLRTQPTAAIPFAAQLLHLAS
eukprot:7363538-Prymnesium_polylepis.1